MREAEVRDVRKDELDELLELYRHLHTEDAPLPARPEVERLWREILSSPLLHTLVIETEGRLVAACTLVVTPNLTRGGRPYGLIENVVTHADHRRLGLGARLMAGALARAWSLDCYKVMLLTAGRHPGAHRLYRKSGFDGGEKTGYVARPPEDGRG